MRIASICGDIILMPPELAEGLLIPSSKATPAWVAMPPLLELLLMENNVWIDSSFFGAFELVKTGDPTEGKSTGNDKSYGFVHGDGFLISSMRPAMFFRNKLCIFFSSISRNFMTPRCMGGIWAGAAIFPKKNLELASDQILSIVWIEMIHDLSRLF